jgi:hypothetical protein
MRMALVVVDREKGGGGHPAIQTFLILGEGICITMKHRSPVGSLIF